MLNISECHIDIYGESTTSTAAIFAFLQNNNAKFFTDERLQSYAQTAAAQNFDLNKLQPFVMGTCLMSEKKNADAFIYAAEAIFNPSFVEFDVRKAVADTKFSARCNRR